MRIKDITEVRMIGEGNWRGASPHNFMLTEEGWRQLHEIAKLLRINHSSTLEIIISEKYYQLTGKGSQPIRYVDGRKAE